MKIFASIQIYVITFEMTVFCIIFIECKYSAKVTVKFKTEEFYKYFYL